MCIFNKKQASPSLIVLIVIISLSFSAEAFSAETLPDRPVAVNLQVDLENESDLVYLDSILEIVEAKNWILTVYVTGEMAEKHPDAIYDINQRGHYIGIHGWSKGERLIDLDYHQQYILINKSISIIRSLVDNPLLVVDFKSQNFLYNNDTIDILQELGVKSITGFFSSDEPFCKCPYAKSIGKITFPYPITNDFVAVPVSDIEVDSSDILLDDSVFFDNINSVIGTTISSYNESSSLTYLKDAYNEHNISKDPLVLNVHPSITGTDSNKLNTLSQFVDYVEQQESVIKPTAPITVQGNYIAYVYASGPSNAKPDETITISVSYNALIYCPTYYFKAYGKYPGQNWIKLSQSNRGGSTGHHSFSMQAKIPEPPAGKNEFIIRVVGKACAGTCWPSEYSYEAMDEFTVNVKVDAARIKLTASPGTIRINEISTQKAQLQDEFGNDVARSGVQIVFSETTSPDHLGTINPSAAVTDSSGIATTVFTAGDQEGTATIKASSGDLQDGNTEIIIVDEKPIITDVKGKYENVFVSGIEVINRYSVFVDWGKGEPGKIIFKLNEHAPVQVTATSGNPSASSEYSMGLDFYVWPGKNELKIIAVNKDEIESDPFILNPKILPFSPWMLILLRPDDFSVKLSPPLVEYDTGFKFPKPEIDEKVSVPCWIPYVGGKLGANAGVNFNLNLKSSGDGSGKLTGSSKIYRDAEVCDEAGFDIKGSAFGKANVVLDAIELKSGELGIEVGGSISKTLPIIKVFPSIGAIVEAAEKIPVVGKPVDWFANRAKIQGSVGPSIAAKSVFTEGKPGACMEGIDCHGEYDLAMKILLALKLAVKKNIEASIYGGGSPTISLQSPDPNGGGWIGIKETAIKMLGGLKLKVWKFKAELECLYKWPGSSRVDCGYDLGFNILSKNKNNLWNVIKRDYANKDYSTFVGSGIQTFSSISGPTQESPLIHNIYPYAQPALAANGDALLVWVHDDVNKPNMQGEEIYYSLWNGNTWSQPLAITNNYKLEFSPDIAFESSGNAVAAWEYNKNIFNEENATLDENFTSGFEIAYSIFNKTSLTWDSPTLLTNNEYTDYNPELVVDENGNVILIWTVNDNNTENLYYAMWDGSDFSTPNVLKSNYNTITQSFAYKNGKLLHVWSKDSDDNFSTIDDEELYSSEWNGNSWSTTIRITGDNYDDEYPSVLYNDNTPILLWIKVTDNGNMLYQSDFESGIWTNQRLVSVNTSIIDYQVLKDENKNLVLIWEEIGKYGPDIFYLVYDELHDSWSNKKKLTKDIALEESMTSIIKNDSLLISYLKTDIQVSNITTNLSGNEVDINDFPIFGNKSLYVLNHKLYKDISIEKSDLILSNSNPVPGEIITINATVHNVGDLSIDSIKVAFYDGLLQIYPTHTINTINAGDNASVSINWTVPLVEESHTIYVKIDPSDEIIESNETNNIASINTVLPDLLVNWSFVSYPGSTGSSDKININTSINNNGSIPSSNFSVRFYYSNYTDSSERRYLIDTKTINSIDDSSSEEVGVVWNISKINMSWYNIIVVVDPDNRILESDDSNNEYNVLAKVLPDLTLKTHDIKYFSTFNGNVSLNITIHNTGLSDAENVTVDIYNGSPVSNSRILLVNKTISFIGKKNYSEISHTLSTSPGMYDFYVDVDRLNKVDELDESNNMALRSARILQPLNLTYISPVDTDGDGLYNYLGVEISANITQSGEYHLSGILNDINGDLIERVSDHVHLNTGEQSMNLNFSGIRIRQHGKNGPYSIENLRLYDGRGDLVGEASGAYHTLVYNYLDFQKIPVEFNNLYTDSGVDSDLDGLFNYLSIGVRINVTTPGNYTIEGQLYDSNESYITYAHNLTWLDTDDQIVYLNFDGITIREHGVNGLYQLYHLVVINENGNEINYQKDAYDTSSYRYIDFQQGGSIKGYVTDINGLPVSDVRIYVNGPGFSSTTTGFDGSYMISRLKTGNYAGNVLSPEYSDLLGTSFTLNVIAGNVYTVNFTLLKEARINGFVNDTMGLPVLDAVVQLTGPTYATGNTGKNGSYAFSRLNEGGYTAQVRPHPLKNLMSDSKSITLTANKTSKLNFTLKPAGSIAGRITDINGSPVTNAVVFFSGYETPRYSVNSTGYYLIGELPAGSRTINVYAPGYSSWYIGKEGLYLGSGTSSSLEVFLNQTSRIDFSQKMIFKYADLELNESSINFSDESPLRGKPFKVSAKVFNNGDGDVTRTEVRFYSGTPSAGNEIGSKTISVPGNGSATAVIIPSNISGNYPLEAGMQDIYAVVDPDKLISELNETNNIANTSINVTPNLPPEIYVPVVSPSNASWNTPFIYNWSMKDPEGDNIRIKLQIFINDRWQNTTDILCSSCINTSSYIHEQMFSSVDRGQTARYRLYYGDEIIENDYSSGIVNSGFYPTESGISGPTIDAVSFSLGTVEGGGTGYGSSFYSWYSYLYTIVLEGDIISVVASDTINKAGVYDYTDNKWYYYPLNQTYEKGNSVNITSIFGLHTGHFVKLNLYNDTVARNFHMTKYTSEGGMVAGGYPGRGTFSPWYTSAHSIVLPGDNIFAAVDAPVDTLGVYSYYEDRWDYYNITTITPQLSTTSTVLPTGKSIDLTPYMEQYYNKMVIIKLLQDQLARNFHLIKRTKSGGIVEGGGGDGSSESSFYSYSSTMYTVFRTGDRFFVSSDEPFNAIRIYDYYTSSWDYIDLDRGYYSGESAEINETSYSRLSSHINNYIKIHVYNDINQNNFHMIKKNQNGGIVEGGYAESGSSFGSSSDYMYTLFNSGERILAVSTGDFNSLKIYNYSNDEWKTIDLDNIYQNFSLVDITPYISGFENNFIQIQVYKDSLKRSYHLIKTFELQNISRTPPLFSDQMVSPAAGSWQTEYAYTLNVSSMASTAITLQVFANNRWINVETKYAEPDSVKLKWYHKFTCLDRNQTSRYRFYYNDGLNAGYYPGESGSSGAVLNDRPCGIGIVEGAGTGSGSSFSGWSNQFYTIVQDGDTVSAVASDSVNRVGIYDYADDTWYYQSLNRTYFRGIKFDITPAFSQNLNKFIQIRLFYNNVARSFHIVKKTANGDAVEGGDSNYGTFSSWSTSAHTVVDRGDFLYAAADQPVNSLSVYDYSEGRSYYYNITTITPLSITNSITIIPKAAAFNITPYIKNHTGSLVQIKILQDTIERSFHLIKRTKDGGIVESGGGDNNGVSSFYKVYSDFYTLILEGDELYITSDSPFRYLKIYDFTKGSWSNIDLGMSYNPGQVFNFSSRQLEKYQNKLLRIQVYGTVSQVKFHLLKKMQKGGFVEGGYPGSTFGLTGNEAYTVLEKGDRILIAADDYVDNVRVYDHSTDRWLTIPMNNVYQKYSLVDVTPYLSGFEDRYIKIQFYLGNALKNFHIIKTFKEYIAVSQNISLSNETISPKSGSWKNSYKYSVDIDTYTPLNITLQIFTNNRWTNAETKYASSGSSNIEWEYKFTCFDTNQTSRYRFYYDDGLNTNYYPSESGTTGVTLDSTTCGTGIVESGGSGSFYIWSSNAYTVAQGGDRIFVTASDTVNKVAIYDYSENNWYYYLLDKTYVRGENIDVTSVFSSHLDKLVQVMAYFNGASRNFHIIKETAGGGIVEGGYTGGGSSFSAWSQDAYTMILHGDNLYAVADVPVDTLAVYNYSGDKWDYHEITTITPGSTVNSLENTVLPRGVLINISSYLQTYINNLVRIKLQQGTTDKNFHLIKRTSGDGIVESGDGSSSYGSSFYSWYSYLYTPVLADETLFMAADGPFDRLRVYDYTKGVWDYINLGRIYGKGEVAEIEQSMLSNYKNNILQLKVYYGNTQRNFHLIKRNIKGGIVEGGYPGSNSAFGSWSANMYTLLRNGETLLITTDDYINSIKVYDYSKDELVSIDLNNVYQKYSFVDITPYIEGFRNRLIQIQVYYGASQKNFHMVKIYDKTSAVHTKPNLSGDKVEPMSGTWKKNYTFHLNISNLHNTNLTLQVFANNRWINSETKYVLPGTSKLDWDYRYTCLASGMTKYRFYYSDSYISGYFPSESGAYGPDLSYLPCGMGIAEGAGSGAGSSFYYFGNSHLFTAVSSSDRVFITANEPLNNLRLYDYSKGSWFTYQLNQSYNRGIPVDITSVFVNHIDTFVQIKAYYDDSIRNIHMVKQTSSGDFIEGGHVNSGSSFNHMALYSNTIVQPGDGVYVIPEYDINRVGIYNYTNSSWYYYSLNNSASAYRLLDITPYTSDFENTLIQIKVLTDSTERNYHIIKRNPQGGIVEGAGVASGSSFYPWYSSLYTVFQQSDSLYIAPEYSVNKVAVYDYTQDSWSYYYLNNLYVRGQAIDISKAIQNHSGNLIRIMMYEGTNYRNFHMLKLTEEGGMVEGGYPDVHSAFNSWSNDMYTLLRTGDRLLVTGTDYFDSAKVYDYTDGTWHDIDFNNVFSGYSLVDLTQYLSGFSDRFILIRLYNGNLQINYHLIKTSDNLVSDNAPDLVVSSVDSPPYNILADSIVPLTAEISNKGSSDAFNFIIMFTDENGTKVGQDKLIYLLNASESKKIYTVWNAAPGVHTIHVTADFLNTVNESDESNNEASMSVFVLPDLRLEEKDITFSGIYRRTVTVDEKSGSNLTDHQINITLDTRQLILENKMRRDCGDIRFRYFDNGSGMDIPYWLEGRCNSPDTRIWMKIPFVPAGSQTTVYMYYGNLSNKSTSSYIDTMERVEPDNNTVALWHFDEGSGNIVRDSTGNINDGAIYGASWVDGKSEKALKFDGVNDYVGIPDTPSLSITNTGLTLEAWIKPYSKPAGIIHKENQYSIYLTNDGKLTYADSLTWSYSIVGSHGTIPVNGNDWTHVAVTKSGNSSTVKFYINGQDVGTYVRSSGNLTDNSNGVVIGSYAGTSNFFNGLIDEVALYNHTLTANEIRLHFENHKIVSPAPDISVGQEELTGNVKIQAGIYNNGGVNASNVSVRFYDGEGGALIGSTVIDKVPSTHSEGFDYSTDIDQDGDSELVFGSAYNGVYIVDPVEKTTLWHFDPNGGSQDWCNALSINDVDNDGKPELVFSCNSGNRFYVYGYNDSYPLDQEFSYTVGDIYNSESGITTGDVDNDGTFEILLPDASTNPDHIEVWGWNGTTYILESNFYPPENNNIHEIATGDVDNDGTVEIIFNEYENSGVSLYIYGYNGSDYVQEWRSVDLGGYLQGIVIEDTDNDNILEIWTGDRDHYSENGGGAVFVYEYDFFSGEYRLEWVSSPNENGFSHHMSPASIADWDNDGWNEIAIGSYVATDGYGHIWIYQYNISAGKYLMEREIKPPSSSTHPASPTFGDYDNDNNIELMIGDRSGNVYIYDSDGKLEWSNGNYGEYAAGWSGDNALITGMQDPRSKKKSVNPIPVSVSWEPTSGIHDIIVVIDEADLISELNESNNIAHKLVTFENLSDLEITSSDIEFLLEDPRRGEFETINVTVHNTKNAPVFNVPLEIYYSDDLEDNFNDGDASDWNIIEGKWDVESGQLSGEGRVNRDARIIVGKNWSDYIYEGKFRIIEGSGSEAGLLFRVEDVKPGINQGHYYQIINYASSNRIYLYRISDGYSTITSSPYTIDPGIWYSFRIVLEGATVKYYIDNDLVLTYDNLYDYRKGGIGVKAYNSHTHFDDLKVTVKGIIQSLTIPYIANESSITIHVTPDSNRDTTWLLEEGNYKIHASADPENLIAEENESNNAANRVLNVMDNFAPVFSNESVIPLSGSWKDEFTYLLNMSDDTGYDTVNITLQVYSNEQWLDVATRTVDTSGEKHLTWNTSFTAIDTGKIIRYRFNYTEYVSSGPYYSGIINTGYYPDENGTTGPEISNESGIIGIVEGSGAGYGSSFYLWHNSLYTAALPGDEIYIAAGGSIDNIRIYDYSTDQWSTYKFPMLDAGIQLNITKYTSNHTGNFIQIKAYSENSEIYFHMLKYTASGGIVEGGYPGNGGSFTSWSKYVYTLVQQGDRFYVAPELPVNRIAVYDDIDEYWHYHNLSIIADKGKLEDITSVLLPYMDRLVAIKVLQDNTEVNFHIIKQKDSGGIEEGSQGDSYGSPFYPRYSTLYTTFLEGDRLFVSVSDQFNNIRVYDYTNGSWDKLELDKRYNRSEIFDITKYLLDYKNRMIAINVYHYDNIRSFHMLKQTQNSGFVEGGYPNSGSSFGEYGGEKYVLFRPRERILVTPNADIDSIKVFNYAGGYWQTIDLPNVYAGHRTLDITGFLSGFEKRFIKLQLFYGQSQKNYHMVKLTEKPRESPISDLQFSDTFANPKTGSWKDDFSIGVTLNTSHSVNVTLQVLSNDLWIDAGTKQAVRSTVLEWNHSFTCLDSGQVKYRFHYISGENSGYYPSESGITEIVLEEKGCGFGIVEGTGNGQGSSFYEWSSSLYTVVQEGDTIYSASNDAVNKVQVYDYTDDASYEYNLNKVYFRGMSVNLTEQLWRHTNHLINIKLYYNDIQRRFHLIKYTREGGIVEGAYAGYGSSFTSWSTYVYTMLQNGDRTFVAANIPFNTIAVYDYLDEYWHYYNLNRTISRAELTEITDILLQYEDRFIEIKVLQDATEANFHLIKRTHNGGIVEGAEGGSSGSSFYSWYTKLYTTLLKSDRVFVSANNHFNNIRVFDYTDSTWHIIELDRRYNKTDVVDISEYLKEYTNRLIAIGIYHYDNQRSFHMIKQTLNGEGDIVEGGYPGGHSTFNEFGTDIYTLIRPDDRFLVTSDNYIDSIKVYNYTDDKWYEIDLGNVHPKYRTVDITNHLSPFENHFIRLQVYYGNSQKRLHPVKMTGSLKKPEHAKVWFTEEYATPETGSWKDDFNIGIKVTTSTRVNVTLQVLSNDIWINTGTKQVTGNANLEWDHNFTCLDSGLARYRFHYITGENSGYYPSEYGTGDILLEDIGCGFGTVEGAGNGYGSSFYEWTTKLFTVVQKGDTIYAASDDAVNKVQIYDYTDDINYEYILEKPGIRGIPVNLTEQLERHADHFVSVMLYYNDIQRSFHMVKYTKEGGLVEGGYAGYGSSFTSWSKYVYTMLQNGDRVFVAANIPFNRIAVYDYLDEYWHYFDLNRTIGKAELAEITQNLLPYTGKFIEIKVLQNTTEANFHMIKRTHEGGIIEGAEGGSAGSPFYSWYTKLYTTLLKSDRVFVSANNYFNNIRVYDHTDNTWHIIDLDRRYDKTDIVDITEYLKEYENKLIAISIYHYDNQRSFHMIKKTLDGKGDIVEGGYSNGDSSFGSWGLNMYTLLSKGERVLVTPNDYFDSIRVYEYPDDRWHIINLSNVYSKFRPVDITNHLNDFENTFINIQIYNKNQQKNYHMVKFSSIFDRTEILAVENLMVEPGKTWLNWSWTNPVLSDFSHVMVYVDGNFIFNLTKPQNYYNATGFAPNTKHKISTRTVNEAGTVSHKWMNNTATTLSEMDILSYYRNLGNYPDVVETIDLLRAADDWSSNITPPGFTESITTRQLLTLAEEWSVTSVQSSIKDVKAQISASAYRDIEIDSVYPGESFNVTINVTSNISQALALREYVTSVNWIFTGIWDDSDIFKKSTNEWVWFNVNPGEIKTVKYSVSVPADEPSGNNYINGSITNASGTITNVSGENLIFVKKRTFEASARRDIEIQNLTSGSSTNITISIKNYISQALSLQEKLPSGWTLTRISDDADIFKAITNEWIWFNMDTGDMETIIYRLDIPVDAVPGSYYIDGNIANSNGSITDVEGEKLVNVISETRHVKTILLEQGWNLISVPLNLTTWEIGEETVVGNPLNVSPANCLSSIYRYNTASGLFEKSDHFDNWGWWPATGSESFAELEPGRGYWVMAQQDCSLTFTGTEPYDLNVPLDSGWNLIGWFSMNKPVLGEESVAGNPFNVIPANSLTSIYRYNAGSGLFEKSDHFDNWGWWPATGSESFTELEPGRGYWVMARNACEWRCES